MMRRIPRIYEPLVDSAIGRITGQQQSSYVCKRCIRRNAASMLPARASQFSTSARCASSLSDSMKAVRDGITGKTSMDTVKDKDEGQTFTPATTWEGLEWVGTKTWYEQTKRPQEAFEAYGPINAPLKDRTEIRDELLKAIVEIFTIRNAAPETWQEIAAQANLDQALEFPKGIRIGCDQSTGEPIFEFESQEVGTQLLEYLTQTSSPRTEAASEARKEQAQAQATPATGSFTFADLADETHGKWSSISLEDLEVRFAIAKRVQQRTGLMLHDPQIMHSKTVGAMFVHLWKPEKPKKFAQQLLGDEELVNLPNVKIADHRVTYVDREREVGRWKVIEEELAERGISPLGKFDRSRRGAKV